MPEGHERFGADNTYTARDARDAFEAVGLGPGQTVFLTAGFGFLGKFDGSDPFAEVVAELSDVLGPNGSIIVPTYSYSFGSEAPRGPEGLPVFSVEDTPSKLGHFSEWFRLTQGEQRSSDPMVSVSIKGMSGFDLFDALPPTSYGRGCLFERLLDVDCSVVNLGLGTKWTPFIHYVDYLCQVPHRYEKVFTGIISQGGGARTVEWHYHVPYRIPNARGLGERNGLAALEEGVWQRSRIGRAHVYRASYQEYFEFTLERTHKDSWNLAAGPPVDLSILPIAN